jgi:uncharacterized radical SAM superfamily Fe-S cluster-containing enzyme
MVRIVENIAKTSMRLVLVPTIVSTVDADQISPTFDLALGHSRHITGVSIQPAAHVRRVELAS